MKRIDTAWLLSATALLLLALSSPASAQLEKLKNTTPEERAKAQTAMMKTKLELTPEQTAKVAAINEKYAQKMEPILKGDDRPLMQMRKVKQITDAKEGELKQVLSPEQFDKYLASKEEMREKVMEKMQEKAQEKHAGGE